MAVFTPRALSIPNMRTDYSAENSAFSNLGQTLGNLIPDMQKQQLAAKKEQILGQIGSGNLDYEKAGKSLIALGDTTAGAALLGLGQKQQQLDAQKGIAGIFSGGASPAPLGSTAPVSGPASLIQNESGGNWQAQNNAVGSGGAVGHFGRGQFSVARLEDAKRAGAIPPDTTPQTFMNSPEMQKRAEAWHFGDIDNFIQANGYDKMIGQTINGVPVTVDGMRAVAHLGGTGGLRKFIESGGQYNPSDRNGTSLMDYFSRHGGNSSPLAPRMQIANPVAQPQQPVQVAENEADVARLEAQMPGYGGAQPAQVAQATVAGDNVAKLRADAQYYAQSNPEAARQFNARADALERGNGGQVAQAPGAADLPPQGANAAPTQAQGFAVPGNMLPPNDPFPRVTTQQLYGIWNNPNASEGQKAMAKSIIDNRQKYSDENAPDKRALAKAQAEKAQLDLDKARREAQGEGATPLTAEERKNFGIAEGQAAYKTRSGEIKFGPAGTTIKNEGTIPPGYRAVRDPNGNLERVEPIPGSKAEREANDLAEKKTKADRIKGEVGTTVGNALDDIDRLMKSATLPTTGAIGSRLASMPGTAAHDISQALSTVGANISFSQLQQMRESSPTGGALGNVTEGEQKMLQNSFAALSQSQSEEQFKTNLGRVRAVFERIVHGRTLTPQERKTGGPMTMERAKGLRDEAAAAIAGGAPRDAVMKRLKEDYGISPEGL